MAEQTQEAQTELPGNNTEKLGRNRLERETLWPADNNFQPSLLHFQYYEMHAEPNAELYCNPKKQKLKI